MCLFGMYTRARLCSCLSPTKLTDLSSQKDMIYLIDFSADSLHFSTLFKNLQQKIISIIERKLKMFKTVS